MANQLIMPSYEISIKTLGRHVGKVSKILAGDAAGKMLVNMLQHICDSEKIIVLDINHGCIIPTKENKETLEQ